MSGCGETRVLASPPLIGSDAEKIDDHVLKDLKNTGGGLIGGTHMQTSATRIRASHVGRLPAPQGWEDMPARLANAEVTDRGEIARQVVPAIAEMVKKQVEIGIDCVNDGEFWTARNFAHYAATFTGLEVRWRSL